MRSTSLVALAFAALLSACGGEASTEPFSSEVTNLNGHLDSFEQALTIHANIIAQAPDLTAVMAEEDNFRQTMVGHMDGMSGTVEHMGMCSDGSGNHPSMGHMEGHMSAMSEDCLAHHEQMQSAVDLDAAHAEETAHQQMMQDHLDAMRSEADSMMHGGMMEGGMMGHGDDMTCPAE